MITIGRKDKIDLPNLELSGLVAKVDTGAYGCALHCHHIEVIEENGIKILSFDVLDPSHPEYEKKVFRFEQFGDKVVRSANGQTEHRYTIKTKLIIFENTYSVEFSLTNRIEMKYPVLLGRKFLSKRFLVDVSLTNLSEKLKPKRK